jgi:hypothetical protein
LGKSQTLALEKSILKLFSDPSRRNFKTKSALPNNFPLGPKGAWSIFGKFLVVFEVFASWGFGHEANSKSVKVPKLARDPHGDGPK